MARENLVGTTLNYYRFFDGICSFLLENGLKNEMRIVRVRSSLTDYMNSNKLPVEYFGDMLKEISSDNEDGNEHYKNLMEEKIISYVSRTVKF